MHEPWNRALRGYADESAPDERFSSRRLWSTCLAILLSALKKVSRASKLVVAGKLYRGIDESKMRLPARFWCDMAENDGFPCGTE